eukprot:155396-Chlamydomonas_euryale.AAC.14
MSELSATQVQQVAWAYAVRNIQDIKLYNAIAFRAGPIIGKFKPYELAILSWSFARQGLHQKNLLDVTAKGVGTSTWPTTPDRLHTQTRNHCDARACAHARRTARGVIRPFFSLRGGQTERKS